MGATVPKKGFGIENYDCCHKVDKLDNSNLGLMQNELECGIVDMLTPALLYW